LLIVGMHRSGTSLLGGLLQRLGVALPGEQIAADHHNPEGYFESREVVDLQERLLIDLDRWWPSANGCLALPPNWLQHPATLATRVQLRELLRAERCRQQGPWAIKDPRTSRLLPLWLDLAAELGIPLRLLLAVRDPAEVARSLIQRDGPITGMDLALVVAQPGASSGRPTATTASRAGFRCLVHSARAAVGRAAGADTGAAAQP
jgi:hypothetical protein